MTEIDGGEGEREREGQWERVGERYLCFLTILSEETTGKWKRKRE
jgi:hypothetical protein